MTAVQLLTEEDVAELCYKSSPEENLPALKMTVVVPGHGGHPVAKLYA